MKEDVSRVVGVRKGVLPGLSSVVKPIEDGGGAVSRVVPLELGKNGRLGC